METKWSVYYPESCSSVELKSSYTLYGRIKRACETYQNRTAIEYWGSRYTYAELIEMIDAASIMWANQGVMSGDRVLICMGACPEVLLTVYALDRIGATAVMTIPNGSTEHFIKLAGSSGARFCLMSFNQYENYAESLSSTKIMTVIIGRYGDYIKGLERARFKFFPLSAYDAEGPLFRRNNVKSAIVPKPWESAMEFAMESNEKHAPYDDNKHISLILEPENQVADEGDGVCYDSETINVATNISLFIQKESEDRLGRPARVLCLNENCYVFGFNIGLNDVLIAGQTLILFTWFDPGLVSYSVRKTRPDTIVGYSGTVATLNATAAGFQVLKNVSKIICGGSLLTDEQKEGLVNRAGGNERTLKIVSVYGCDEVCGYAYTPMGMVSDRLIGIPLPGILMKIADSTTGADVPQGKEGELAVCSPLCYSGRLKEGGKMSRPPLRHLPDGREWLFTGNVGKMNESGFFFLVSTASRVCKINSFPVYPILVDKVVSMVEGVVDVASVVIDTESGAKLVCAVVPEEHYLYDNPGLENLKSRIIKECKVMLHEAMCPSRIEFAVSLPEDKTGKKDYRKVSERIREIENTLSE